MFIVPQLNDIQVIEEASGYLNKREQSAERNDSDLEKQMSTLNLGKEDAFSNIRKAIADFSRLAVLLERIPITLEVCISLQTMPNHVQVISESLKSLQGDEYPETVTKLSRALRGLHHRIEKASGKKSSNDDIPTEWDTALDQWMLSLGPCIGNILANELTVRWHILVPHGSS